MRMNQLEADCMYLRQMIDYIERVEKRLEEAKRYGLSLQDEMVVDALAMNLGQIGEQLSQGKLSEETKERYADLVPWRRVKDFRNLAYHSYDKVDSFSILKIVHENLPTLKEHLLYILSQIQQEQSNR